MDELRKTRDKAAKGEPVLPPAVSAPLSQMAVSEDEIAVVEAFLGLHFATIFGQGHDKENLARKKAAIGG